MEDNIKSTIDWFFESFDQSVSVFIKENPDEHLFIDVLKQMMTATITSISNEKSEDISRWLSGKDGEYQKKSKGWLHPKVFPLKVYINTLTVWQMGWEHGHRIRQRTFNEIKDLCDQYMDDLIDGKKEQLKEIQLLVTLECLHCAYRLVGKKHKDDLLLPLLRNIKYFSHCSAATIRAVAKLQRKIDYAKIKVFQEYYCGNDPLTCYKLRYNEYLNDELPNDNIITPEEIHHIVVILFEYLRHMLSILDEISSSSSSLNDITRAFNDFPLERCHKMMSVCCFLTHSGLDHSNPIFNALYQELHSIWKRFYEHFPLELEWVSSSYLTFEHFTYTPLEINEFIESNKHTNLLKVIRFIREIPNGMKGLPVLHSLIVDESLDSTIREAAAKSANFYDVSTVNDFAAKVAREGQNTSHINFLLCMMKMGSLPSPHVWPAITAVNMLKEVLSCGVNTSISICDLLSHILYLVNEREPYFSDLLRMIFEKLKEFPFKSKGPVKSLKELAALDVIKNNVHHNPSLPDELNNYLNDLFQLHKSYRSSLLKGLGEHIYAENLTIDILPIELLVEMLKEDKGLSYDVLSNSVHLPSFMLLLTTSMEHCDKDSSHIGVIMKTFERIHSLNKNPDPRSYFPCIRKAVEILEHQNQSDGSLPAVLNKLFVVFPKWKDTSIWTTHELLFCCIMKYLDCVKSIDSTETSSIADLLVRILGTDGILHVYFGKLQALGQLDNGNCIAQVLLKYCNFSCPQLKQTKLYEYMFDIIPHYSALSKSPLPATLQKAFPGKKSVKRNPLLL